MLTRYQKQLTLGVVGIFLFGMFVGYRWSKWLSPPPCQQPVDLAATAQTPGQSAQSASTVRSVIDGMTLGVDNLGQIKLAGVELPPQIINEESDPAHKDAVTYLNTEVLNKQVRLEKVPGVNGLVYYYVYTPAGTLVNVDMVRRGLVFRSDIGLGEHGDDMRNAMSEAIRNNHGVWRIGSSNSQNTVAAAEPTSLPEKPAADTKGDTKKIAESSLHNDKLTAPPSASSGTKKNELEVVVLPGSSVFHRADCADVKGKTGLVRMYISDARNAGLKPDAKCFTSVTMRAP